MSDINFTANYIRPVQIKKLQGFKYKPYEVSFVQLNTNSDKESLKLVANNWAASMSRLIEFDSQIYFKNNRYHFYALTKQKNKFKNLNPEDILGLLEMKELDYSNKILYIQSKPEYMSPKYNSLKQRIANFFKKSSIREYKHIGTEMLNSIKKLFPNKEIELNSLDESLSFYKKNGFKKNEAILKDNYLIYTPEYK